MQNHRSNKPPVAENRLNNVDICGNRNLKSEKTRYCYVSDAFGQALKVVPRPNRKFLRKHRVKQKRFFFEYKTTC